MSQSAKSTQWIPDCSGSPDSTALDCRFQSNSVTLLELYLYWSLRPVASIVTRVQGIVCVVPSVASFYNHKPCLERYRVPQISKANIIWNPEYGFPSIARSLLLTHPPETISNGKLINPSLSRKMSRTKSLVCQNS